MVGTAAMLLASETVGLSRRQEAELKMWRLSLGGTPTARIGNENSRFGGKAREARLRWFGHVQRRTETVSVGGC